jgi:hypothetical protein
VAPEVNQQRDHQTGLALQTVHTTYTAIEEIPMGEEVFVDTFFLYDQPIIIPFDYGASHDFMS